MDEVLILLIIFGSISFYYYLEYKIKAIKAGSVTGDKELARVNDQLIAKTQALEERVQILESIVTDKKYRLKEEIETL